MQKSSLHFWLQHQSPGLTTWFIGNRTFATSAGEVLTQYQCKQVVVRARDAQGCYQALPVEWIDPIDRGDDQ